MRQTMVEFVCQNCGNKQLRDAKGSVVTSPKAIDVNSQYFCNECGTELPKDQMADLVTAAAAEVVIANNLRMQARNAKNNGDFENALNLYQQLLLQKPDDWEATFYSVYCNCYNAVGAVENACDAVKMSLEGVFDKIDNLHGVEKQNAVKLLVSDAGLFALHMFDSAVQRHASLDVSSMTKNQGALRNQLTSALNIVITCASNVMNRYGDEEQVAALVELPATCALQMQSRQQYVTLFVGSDTNKSLLDWIGKYNPKYVEEYKAKQNRSMRSGTIALAIFAAIFYAIGYFTEGMFSSWFCIPMAIFCGAWAIIRILIQLFNNKKRG